MPRGKQIEKQQVGSGPPYADLAKKMNAWILRWRALHPDDAYNQRAAAAEMGINPTSFSYILNGRYRPTPEQTLVIARHFDIPLEDVIRASGHADLMALRSWVAEHVPPQQDEEGAKERQYILSVLAIALGLEEWQRVAAERWQALPSWNPYKDRAERALASGGDPYMRAKDYADAVYDWGHSKEQDIPRQDRSTQDLPILVANRKVSGGGR